MVKSKVREIISNPKILIIKFLYFISPLLSDRFYLKLLFFVYMGYKLDLRDPKTYNEKLQWLKLNYRLPILTKLVDKYEVKKYVGKKIGEQYIVNNLGVWNSFDEIDFHSLPSKFVLKTTHDQGGIVICRDKSKLNRLEAKRKLDRHLKRKFYYRLREWPYKNVEPRIIAEELLVDANSEEIKDYKFFCFNGEPKVMFISTERLEGKAKFNFYDINFRPLDIIRGLGKSSKIIDKPRNYDLMVQFATILSEGMPHVRVDFYDIGDKLFFGEFTFYSGAGLKPFKPEEWDYTLGSYIDLSK